MRRAIQYLVERGMLVRKRGVGTQVVHPKVRRPVELSSLYDDLVKTGAAPRTEVLDFERRPGARRRSPSALGVPEGTEVTWFERLRYAGGEPLALMHNAVPRRRAAAATGPTWSGTASTSCCARAGHVPRMATQVDRRPRGDRGRGPACCARAAARPLLTMTRTAWDASGRAVEYGSHVYRASRYSFELSLTV